MRQEGGAILLGREQYEVGEALGHHGGDLPEVIGAALDVLLHEFVDVTVQAIGHRAPPTLSIGSPPITGVTNNGVGGCPKLIAAGACLRKRPAPCSACWRSKSGHPAPRSSTEIEHQDVLIRLRAMIEDDLAVCEQGRASSSESAEPYGKCSTESFRRRALPYDVARN